MTKNKSVKKVKTEGEIIREREFWENNQYGAWLGSRTPCFINTTGTDMKDTSSNLSTQLKDTSSNLSTQLKDIGLS